MVFFYNKRTFLLSIISYKKKIKKLKKNNNDLYSYLRQSFLKKKTIIFFFKLYNKIYSKKKKILKIKYLKKRGFSKYYKMHILYANYRFKTLYILRKYYASFFKRRFGICYLKQTKTNIFLTITNKRGKVFLSASGGNCHAKKKREALSTITTEKLGKKALKLMRRFRCYRFYLCINMYFKSFLIKSFLQTLKKDRRLKFRFLIGIKKFAHNGCRLKKKPRK